MGPDHHGRGREAVVPFIELFNTFDHALPGPPGPPAPRAGRPAPPATPREHP
ncbi:MAG: hypothetical protein QOJ25_1529 [Solirubrobacteraceae bacterium]|nr:hypothetical protein [Solirubrobacteraceae bacterium]